MVDLFKEILPSIMETKTSVIQSETDEKDYNSFMVNRALSLHNDCLFYAVEMNRLSHLPKSMQYAYYMSSIRGRKRSFVPWPKKAGSEELKAVCWYFNYSDQKGQQTLNVLNEEEITKIVKVYKETH